MKEQKLIIFSTTNGKEPFTDWLNQLKDKVTSRKIRVRLARVRLGNFGDCKSVGQGVLELKIKFGQDLEFI